MLRKILFTAGAAVGAWAILGRLAPAASRLRSGEGGRFPLVSGYNLNREEVVFPRDFRTDRNILFVPFLRHQQAVVDSWIPHIQEMETSHGNLTYYELPTIERMPAAGRLWVNEGMRAGIPDPVARERTVTLYIDTQEFMRTLHIPDKESVHVFLLDRDGTILWRTSGPFSDAKDAALRQALHATSASVEKTS